MNSNLRDRLSRLARQPATNPGGPARRPGPASAGEAAARTGRSPDRPAAPGRIPPLDRILPGEEVQNDRGCCWRHERPLDGWPGADARLAPELARRIAGDPPADLAADPGLRLWRERGLDAGLFLDLETTGLSATPVFLAGLLAGRQGALVFRLYFARHYGEEPALLAAVAREIDRAPVVVTYNGKSYDLPFLRERAGRLRVAGPRPGAVVDMLHPARRRWGGRLPDCRLQTLEWHLCGRRRSGDIDGARIPETYHQFVRDGDPRPLLRVFQHNLVDLYTLAEVTGHILATPPPAPPA